MIRKIFDFGTSPHKSECVCKQQAEERFNYEKKSSLTKNDFALNLIPGANCQIN